MTSRTASAFFSFYIAIVLAFTLFFYIPFSSYWHGVNEFSFNAQSLLATSIKYFTAFAIVAFGVISLCRAIIPGETIRIKKININITIVDIFIVAILTAIWLEGAVLARGISSITGQKVFKFSYRFFVDAFVWLALIFGSLFFWRRIGKKAFLFLLIALPVLFLTGLGDAYLHKDEKIPVYVTSQIVLANMGFHPKDNIIVIVSDAFPAYMASYLFDKEPELASALEGFIFFRNNLATGGQTTWALPAILQGAVYQGGDYRDFAEKAFTASGSIPRYFADSNRNVYISSFFARYCAIWEPGGKRFNTVPATFDFPTSVSLAFRFLPYGFKWLSEPVVLASQFGLDKLPRLEGAQQSNSWYKNALISQLDNESPFPTGHFHHYPGVHAPFRFDSSGKPLPASEATSEHGFQEYSEWDLRCFVEFLEALKSRGMYDEAVIVLVADHGQGSYMTGKISALENPLLLVKPRKSQGPLTIFEGPFSNAYLARFIREADKGRSNAELFLKKLPEQRKLFRQPEELLRVSGTNVDALEFQPVPIDVTQRPTRLRLGIQYGFARSESIFPLAVAAEMSTVFGPSGGAGIDFLPPSAGALVFDVDAKPGSKIDVDLTHIYLRKDKFEEKMIFSLQITDGITKKTVFSNTHDADANIEKYPFLLHLADVKVGKDSRIYLEFESKGSDFCVHTITGIRIDEHKDE